MPQYICKFPCDGEDYYLIWSSVVDAPITEGMTYDELLEYYKFEYGQSGMKRLQERLARVEETGCSDAISREPLKKWVAFNRAGPNESQLTFEEIIDVYIRRPRAQL